MTDQYDLVAIGGGPGGLAAAQTAAARGKKVLIIEKSGWGGACTHRGCIPTKALLACCKFYTDQKKLKRVGVNTDAHGFDFAAMTRHRDQMVKIAALGAQKALVAAGIEVKLGEAEILSPREVRYTDLSGQTFMAQTENILIAWGAQPQIINNIEPSSRIWTSDGILNMNTLPESIIIVGGSFIGVEYATILAELGVRVILVELLERLLPQEDEEAAAFLGRELIRLGVAVHTATRLVSLEDKTGKAVMRMQKNNEIKDISAESALLCTGRKPLLHMAQLNQVGIDHTGAGIKVNAQMMTSVPGIYAAGDVTGGMMLAHRATLQGKVAAQSILGGGDYTYNEDYIPSVVYSHPQIARVGYTEKRAREEGLAIEVVKSDYGANIIARAELLGQGWVKAVFHQDKIIGAVIVGEHAADLILPLALAVSGKMTKKQLRLWVIPHPTLGEILTPLID